MYRLLKNCIAIAFSFFVLTSCQANAQNEKLLPLCVATWNVQNLFDAKLDGNEYDEYKSQNGWTEEMYQRRLSNVRKTLSSLPKAKDYIIILNEIENSNVVNDILFSADMAKMGLCYYVTTREESSAIQIAVISSLPIEDANVHQVGPSLRPILEVSFNTSVGKIFVLAVHFKSNIGSSAATSEARMQAALVASQIASGIQKNNPSSLVLICGDMNEECWDDGAIGRTNTSALRTSDTFERGSWFCFYLDLELGLSSLGSYMYEGDWKCYDNILISPSGKDGDGYEFSKAGILDKPFLFSSNGKPLAWDRRLLTGFSDHLPVWTIFEVL